MGMRRNVPVTEFSGAFDAPLEGYIRDLRRWFHRHPELSYQ
jgi:metal-dependent amidase/aminoacylase/carboxypeptidase family protein